MNILAVDDDEYALEILVATLKAADYSDITISKSGAEALAKIASARSTFDCFFLDIEMPEMDGIELCRQIRQFNDYRSSPILMITSMSERKFIDGAFSAGATDYVTKPFDPLELSVRVQLAERLVREQRFSTKKIFAVKKMKAKMENLMLFSIGDTITIEDVPGMVEMLAMENYLLQLSRGKAFQSKAVAFAIKEFETLFSRSTPSEIYCTLADVADAIAANFKTANYLLAYCGIGRFVCVTSRLKSVISEELEFAVQSTIDVMEPLIDNGNSIELTLLMGKPSTTSLWASGKSLNLMHAALASVDAKRQQSRRAVQNLYQNDARKTG